MSRPPTRGGEAARAAAAAEEEAAAAAEEEEAAAAAAARDDEPGPVGGTRKRAVGRVGSRRANKSASEYGSAISAKSSSSNTPAPNRVETAGVCAPVTALMCSRSGAALAADDSAGDDPIEVDTAASS